MPGTGSCTASAGRCTPCSRRSPKVAAAIVAPVEPGLTIASARPSATSRGGPHHRGLRLGADRGHRVLLVADPLRGRDDLDPVDAVEAQLAGRAEDANADPVGGGQPRALGEHVEALLGPEAVEGDGHAAPGGHYSSESEGVAGASATL